MQRVTNMYKAPSTLYVLVVFQFALSGPNIALLDMGAARSSGPQELPLALNAHPSRPILGHLARGARATRYWSSPSISPA
jgi:hypothetical protein